MQSREGSAVSYRLPLKWHAPIASVAALTAQPLAALPPYGCGVPFTGGERHAGWHYLRHKFIGARPPSLSFRGAKRRGNLLQPVTFSPRPTCYSTWYCEIATSACVLLAMTNPGASAFHFKFLYTTSPMRHTREALMKAARADGERFLPRQGLKSAGILCTRKGHAASVRRQSRQRLRNISSFSSRWIGEKDPAAAADDFVRASQKKTRGGMHMTNEEYGRYVDALAPGRKRGKIC